MTPSRLRQSDSRPDDASTPGTCLAPSHSLAGGWGDSGTASLSPRHGGRMSTGVGGRRGEQRWAIGCQPNAGGFLWIFSAETWKRALTLVTHFFPFILFKGCPEGSFVSVPPSPLFPTLLFSSLPPSLPPLFFPLYRCFYFSLKHFYFYFLVHCWLDLQTQIGKARCLGPG